MGKFKNRKGTGKDEVIVEMVKGGGDMQVDWIWRCAVWPLRAV